MPPKKVTIYIKPTCTTCKKALSILDQNEIEYDSVDYYKQALSEKELTQLLEKLDIEPGMLLRKRAGVYSELGLEGKELSVAEVAALVLKYPDLLQRPIVACGEDVILARPADEINKILD